MEDFTEEELELIVWDDHRDFKEITKKEVDDQSRWSVYCSKVIQHQPTGNYYRIAWTEGATEMQDTDLNPVMTRVYPKEILTTIYTTTKELK